MGDLHCHSNPLCLQVLQSQEGCCSLLPQSTLMKHSFIQQTDSRGTKKPFPLGLALQKLSDLGRQIQAPVASGLGQKNISIEAEVLKDAYEFY